MAARLIESAFESSADAGRLSNAAVAMLQVAANLFADPATGLSVVLGLEPAPVPCPEAA